MGYLNGTRSRPQQLPEENIMALLDVIGVKEQDDIRLSFIAAIRVICITPEMAQVPTRKMYEAVFQILRENKSLELTITSYQLLLDLEKRFPPVTVAKMSGSSSDVIEAQLVIYSEVWSPFKGVLSSPLSKRNATHLLKEIECLKKLLAEKEASIEYQTGETKKWWDNYCRASQQNRELVKPNSQMSKELALDREKLKLLRHE